MSFKIIQITIPSEKPVPEELYTLTPSENYLILKLGCDTLRESRKSVAELSHSEISLRIQHEFQQQIEQLKNTLHTEQTTSLQMQNKLSKMYETQLEQTQRRLETALSQIKDFENQSKHSLYEEINKVKDKYELLYREKEKQVERITDSYEKLLVQQQTGKTTSQKGSAGEQQFEDFARTFIDFKGFKIIDKHTQGGEGDFHLHFEEFDVLVDAKNYRKKVPVEQRDKIKSDLLKNNHIHFGWLVSLNTPIEKFDRAPVMYEWINTTQCLVYINHLLQHDDPAKLLRIVWFTCKELMRLITDVNFDEEELVTLREERFKLLDKIKNIRKNIREINTSINTTKNLVQSMDEHLKDLLDSQTNEHLETNFSLFDTWWREHIIPSNDTNSTILSTDAWFKFRNDNRDLVKQFELTPDKFKQYIKSKIPLSNITIKSKNANAAFDIHGFQFKDTLDHKNITPISVHLIHH